MLLEDQRFIHEDLERLEQAVADRVAEKPRNVSYYALGVHGVSCVLTLFEQIREELARDHELAKLLNRIEEQSKRLLEIYKDADGLREKEVQSITTGDQFDEFYKQLDGIKDFHKRYPNEPVDNLEKAYKRRQPGEGEVYGMEIDNMFTGEEGFGQFLDLTTLHEDYLNLPGVKRLKYIQYLDVFDCFTPPTMSIKRKDKLSEKYFRYVGELANYLESFIKRVKPLEDFEKLFRSFDEEFDKQWEAKEVPGWTEQKVENGTSGPKTEGTGEGIWCPDCEKEFKNENVYRNHLTGKKHIRAAEARKASGASGERPTGATSTGNLKERAVAEREHRVRCLTKALQDKRQATRTNVERRAGMTERERQMELEALMAEPESFGEGQAGDQSDNEDDDEKIYNPLKLPIAWDGKPIPYWLYKLHGLGVEYQCEICGNHVYMGRRAFDKHFSEATHIHGLKCLGITANTNLFREITSIDQAIRLWESLESERKKERDARDNVVQMEDAEGNVMPERIYLESVFLRSYPFCRIYANSSQSSKAGHSLVLAESSISCPFFRWFWVGTACHY
jgi:splicing factor 3A subunit 3